MTTRRAEQVTCGPKVAGLLPRRLDTKQQTVKPLCARWMCRLLPPPLLLLCMLPCVRAMYPSGMPPGVSEIERVKEAQWCKQLESGLECMLCSTFVSRLWTVDLS